MSIRTPLARARFHNQANRTRQGMQSGQITKQEAKDLKAGRQDIRELVKEAKADGTVTAQERKDIHQALNQQSQDIFEAKHNDQTRNNTPKVDKRQKKQSARMAHGLLNGELTKSEFQELRADKKEIRQAERAAKADGVVSKEEREELHSMLNELSQDIFEMKHNDTKRKRNVFV